MNSEQIWAALLERWPALKEVRGASILAVNQEYVDSSVPLSVKEGDEVAIIPPISGG